MVTTTGGVYYWPSSKERPGLLQNILRCTGHPMTKNYPAPSVHGAEVVKPGICNINVLIRTNKWYLLNIYDILNLQLVSQIFCS